MSHLLEYTICLLFSVKAHALLQLNNYNLLSKHKSQSQSNIRNVHLVFQLPASLGHMWELTQVECSLTPPIHSLYHPPHSHHSGMSPPDVWPLEDDPLELPTSVGYDHPVNWVRHSQYSTQPITCTNEMNVNELNVGDGVLLGCMCVCTIATVHCLQL